MAKNKTFVDWPQCLRKAKTPCQFLFVSRNKAFGSGQELAWSSDPSMYAVRENASTVKVFKNFKEKKAFKPDFGAEAIYGGNLLGIKSPSGKHIPVTH